MAESRRPGTLTGMNCRLLTATLLLCTFTACNGNAPRPKETVHAAENSSSGAKDEADRDASSGTVESKSQASQSLKTKTTAPADAPTEKRDILYVQLLGEGLSKAFFENMAFVRKAIETFFPLDVEMLPVKALPEAAWYPPRRRYRAERLLDYLETVRPTADARVLGITTQDISTTKGEHEDWGILGLATLDGTVCVVSTHRAGGKQESDQRTKLRARYRFAKTVVHELGHNFGLDHCPNRGCLMEDAKGTVKTTDREYTFCDTCWRKLAAAFPDLARQPPAPPWPRPEE